VRRRRLQRDSRHPARGQPAHRWRPVWPCARMPGTFPSACLRRAARPP